MSCRSFSGYALCCCGLAVLACTFAPRAAAAQNVDVTSFESPTSSGSAAEPGAEPDSDKEQSVEQTEHVRRKRNKLRLHWRSASLDYQRKFRIDFRSKFRGEVRGSDAAITNEELDQLDIPRHRVGFDGQILSAVAFKVDRELDS